MSAVFHLCITVPRLWQSSGKDATAYPDRCRAPPRLVPSAPLRPNTAAPILRTSAPVRVPVFPTLRLPSSPPFNAPKLEGKITSNISNVFILTPYEELYV